MEGLRAGHRAQSGHVGRDLRQLALRGPPWPSRSAPRQPGRPQRAERTTAAGASTTPTPGATSAPTQHRATEPPHDRATRPTLHVGGRRAEPGGPFSRLRLFLPPRGARARSTRALRAPQDDTAAPRRPRGRRADRRTPRRARATPPPCSGCHADGSAPPGAPPSARPPGPGPGPRSTEFDLGARAR